MGGWMVSHHTALTVNFFRFLRCFFFSFIFFTSSSASSGCCSISLAYFSDPCFSTSTVSSLVLLWFAGRCFVTHFVMCVSFRFFFFFLSLSRSRSLTIQYSMAMTCTKLKWQERYKRALKMWLGKRWGDWDTRYLVHMHCWWINKGKKQA